MSRINLIDIAPHSISLAVLQECHKSFTIPVVFRDFIRSHPDFELPLSKYRPGVDRNMVAETLGTDEKPKLCWSSANRVLTQDVPEFRPESASYIVAGAASPST
eukprot:g46480.t1